MENNSLGNIGLAYKMFRMDLAKDKDFVEFKKKALDGGYSIPELVNSEVRRLNRNILK